MVVGLPGYTLVMSCWYLTPWRLFFLLCRATPAASSPELQKKHRRPKVAVWRTFGSLSAGNALRTGRTLSGDRSGGRSTTVNGNAGPSATPCRTDPCGRRHSSPWRLAEAMVFFPLLLRRPGCHWHLGPRPAMPDKTWIQDHVVACSDVLRPAPSVLRVRLQDKDNDCDYC